MSNELAARAERSGNTQPAWYTARGPRPSPDITAFCLGALFALAAFVSAAAQTPAPPMAAQEAAQRGDAAFRSKNYPDAIRFYQIAAEQGHPAAQCEISIAFELGRGIPADKAQAVFWNRKAAEGGDPRCQHLFAIRLRTGDGLPHDNKSAVGWVMKAAEGDFVPAQTLIGVYYYGGKEGVRRDDAEALRWFRRSAAHNTTEDDGTAETMIAAMYEEGRGVPQDFGQASIWLLKGAEHGNVDAMSELGAMYENGQGVAVDYEKAVSWYQKAAKAGDIKAKKRLASLESGDRSGRPGQFGKVTRIPGALSLKCYLLTDGASPQAKADPKGAQRRYDECLRSNWKQLFGSMPFPADQ
jgi:TPR repeat protein